MPPHTVGRIPLADGAGVVEAVGAGVSEFVPGDGVVSIFFPQWQAGEPVNGDFTTVPGDGVDGYACERVVRPATWFTPRTARLVGGRKRHVDHRGALRHGARW